MGKAKEEENVTSRESSYQSSLHRANPHLGNQEVDLIFHEDIHLLLKLGLRLLLAETAEEGRGLRDAAGHQRVPLRGHLVG